MSAHALDYGMGSSWLIEALFYCHHFKGQPVGPALAALQPDL